MRTDSSAETSERPKPARAVEEAEADRPATRRPNDDATAELTITASRTDPASQDRAMSSGTRHRQRYDARLVNLVPKRHRLVLIEVATKTRVTPASGR